MNKQKQQNSSEWMLKARKLAEIKKAGEFTINDRSNFPIILEWEIVDQQSSRLNEKIKSLSEILIQTYTQQEMLFAKKHPEAVANEYFLKPLAPLFQNGSDKVEWSVVEKQITDIFKKFFTETDFIKSSAANDLHIFVVAKDKKTGLAIGLIQFLITPEYPNGNIKAAFYGVLPIAHHRGIGKILMSSIFKLLPEVRRIFLHTRATNENAIAIYSSWGFTQSDNKIPNWPDFEYLAEKSNELQKLSLNIRSL